MEVEIDVSTLYNNNTAKISELNKYLDTVARLAGEGNVVIIHGAGPIWLYLKIAHLLHGKARKLIYRSPVTGDLIIFDHDPF
jgi:hypothetical protein